MLAIPTISTEFSESMGEGKRTPAKWPGNTGLGEEQMRLSVQEILDADANQSVPTS